MTPDTQARAREIADRFFDREGEFGKRYWPLLNATIAIALDEARIAGEIAGLTKARTIATIGDLQTDTAYGERKYIYSAIDAEIAKLTAPPAIEDTPK